MSPPFHCLGLRGQGQPLLPRWGLDRTRRILRAPRAPGPAVSCAVPGCEARGMGRAAGSRDGSGAFPGRRGEESGGEDGPRSVHPVLPAWVPAWCLWHPIRRGPCAETVARAGGFHGRWVTAAATLQVGSPWGKAGVAVLWLGDGFPGGQRVLRACSLALLARGVCRVGKASGCRLRPAHSLSWCSPVHPRVPAVSGLCGSAGVRQLTAHPMANGTGKG